MTYKLWVNDEKTVLVRMWDSGNVEVCLRDDPSHVWKPPIYVVEEKT
jgi:hypothetical protein